MNNFLTWETLATFAGCTAATAVFTQFVKNLGGLKNVATQLVSYGIALILLFCATYFTGALTPSVAALIPFNAVIVSLGSNGTFSALTRAVPSTPSENAVTDVVATQNVEAKEQTPQETK